MKTRILSGVGVVVFLIAMLLCTYTPFFSLFLALLSGVAVFEIERVAQVKNKAIMGISVAFSALLPGANFRRGQFACAAGGDWLYDTAAHSDAGAV